VIHRSATDERASGAPAESEGPAHDVLANVFGAIAWRQHVSPKRLVDPGPDAAQIEQLFSAAAAAPDHGEILPWRFVIVPQEKRAALGEAFAAALTDRDPGAAPDEIARARDKALRAPFVVLSIVRLAQEPEPDIPDLERIVSLGLQWQPERTG